MCDEILKTKYSRLYGEIRAAVEPFRVNPFFAELDRQRSSGRILPFVKGLRFSAKLTYAIREILVGSNLQADWGHLVDEDGGYVSPECDIIIHQKDCRLADWWNGEGKKNGIMDFKFIETEFVKVVISCKSKIETSEVEEDYFNKLNEYVDRIWLFAECCGSERKFNNIRTRAQEYGYEDFWCIYTQNSAGDLGYLEDVWFDFVRKVEGLRSDYGS